MNIQYDRIILFHALCEAKFNLKGYKKYYNETFKRYGNLLDIITANPDEMNYTSGSILYRLIGYK